MCDVCIEYGNNWSLKNGEKHTLKKKKIMVHGESAIDVKLCYLCSLELFKIGGSRFMEKHPFLVKYKKKGMESDFLF